MLITRYMILNTTSTTVLNVNYSSLFLCPRVLPNEPITASYINNPDIIIAANNIIQVNTNSVTYVKIRKIQILIARPTPISIAIV